MHKFITIDYSYSTNKETEYWYKIAEYLRQSGDGAVCIFWDDRKNPEIMTLEKAIIQAEKSEGYYGTDPSTLIQYLPSNEPIKLTIFTDGEIHPTKVKKCENLLDRKNVKIKHFKIFYIGTESLMNLSIQTAFLRESRIPEDGEMTYEININGRSEGEKTNFCNPLNLKKYWNQPRKFLLDETTIYQKLDAFIVQNLGNKTDDEDLRNELVKLQNNLLYCCAKENKSDDTQKIIDNLINALKNGQYDAGLTLLKILIQELTVDKSKKITAIFQDILNKFDKELNFSFDNLVSNRVARATEVKQTTIHDVEAPENIQTTYTCPIRCDYDVPILCIRKGEPVLKDLTKKYQDLLINNPLYILENTTLVDKIKERIDHAIGFNSAEKLVKNKPSFISPTTRQPISSFISMSNEPTHQESTQYGLADLFFGKKLCGVPSLWLAVVFFVAENLEYLHDESESFLNSFRKSLVWTLNKHKTYISLSGSPENGPLIKVTVAVALWYCIVSPLLNGVVPNRLRTIGTVYHLKLLNLIGYIYEKEWTLHQLSVYKVSAFIQKQVKNRVPVSSENQKKSDCVVHQDSSMLLNWIRSLYQNSLTLPDGFIVILDGPPKKDPKSLRVSLEKSKKANTPLNEDKSDKESDEFSMTLKCSKEDQYDKKSDEFRRTLSIGELLALCEKVDPSKKSKDIAVSNKLCELPIPKPTTNYNVQENEWDGSHPKLCSFTLRPYSIDPVSNKKWKQASEEKFGALSGQISIYNYLVRYIIKHREIPSEETFIKWVALKESQRKVNRKDTLCKSIREIVSCVFNQYEEAIKELFSDKYQKRASELFKVYPKNLSENFTLKDIPIEFLEEIIQLSRDKKKRRELELECIKISNEPSDKELMSKSSFFVVERKQLDQEEGFRPDEGYLAISKPLNG